METGTELAKRKLLVNDNAKGVLIARPRDQAQACRIGLMKDIRGALGAGIITVTDQ